MEDQVCVVEDLYQEGFVDCEDLVVLPGLQVLLPLVVLMEDFALVGFSEKYLFLLCSQLLLHVQLFLLL